MIRDCNHGMPSPASCVECMAIGPVAPPRPSSTELLAASVWMHATFDSRCARNRGHEIERGDLIGLVDDLGWCCEQCLRRRQGAML